MDAHEIVSRDEWLTARRALLAKEKELTQLRDRLSAERRALPWVRVEKAYRFQAPEGEVTLADLFDGRSQLVVYHFMFGPDWEGGCKSCSFWADSFDRIVVHLAQRDVTLVAISRAPIGKLEAFRKRMGWGFRWVSSLGSDFNYDFGVSFTDEQLAHNQAHYNYDAGSVDFEEWPGVSVFYRDPQEGILHTYSCYARGIDPLNAAYQYLDLVPKGRDEDGLPWPMAWVGYRDEYAG